MKITFLLTFLLFPIGLIAQERFTVRGRIIDENGEAVEYVQIGVRRLQLGTISTADGQFEIAVPRDTLVFFHVSYQPASYPVAGPAEDVVIILHEQELPPAVSISGNAKEKYLLRPGTNVLKNMGIITTALQSEHPLGRELGSVAQVKRPFLVKDIRPEESILLEPGRYFIAFQIVGYEEQALQAYLAKPEEERKFWEMTMDFNVFLKSSYLQETALGDMEHYPVNIGVAVKGLEYQ